MTGMILYTTLANSSFSGHIRETEAGDDRQHRNHHKAEDAMAVGHVSNERERARFGRRLLKSRKALKGIFAMRRSGGVNGPDARGSIAQEKDKQKNDTSDSISISHSAAHKEPSTNKLSSPSSSPTKTVNTSTDSGSLHTHLIFKHDDSHDSDPLHSPINQQFTSGAKHESTQVVGAQVAGASRTRNSSSKSLPASTTHPKEEEETFIVFDPFETSFAIEESNMRAIDFQQVDFGSISERHHQQHHEQRRQQQARAPAKERSGQETSTYCQETMPRKQSACGPLTVRDLLVSRRRKSQQTSGSLYQKVPTDVTFVAKEHHVSDLHSLPHEHDEQHQATSSPTHQYIIRMESRIRSTVPTSESPFEHSPLTGNNYNPNGTTTNKSNSQPNLPNAFSACTVEMNEAVKHVAFDDKVLNVIEGSKVELNQMVRKISHVTSEPIFTRISSCGTPRAASGNVGSDESILSTTPTWQQSVTDQWNSFIMKPTVDEDDNSKALNSRCHLDKDAKKGSEFAMSPSSFATKNDEEDEGLGRIPARYSMIVEDPVNRNTSRLSKKTNNSQVEPPAAEASFVEDITGFIGSVNDGLVSIAGDVQKSNWLSTKGVWSLVDCLNPSAHVNNSDGTQTFPLEESWFSTDESDSISKLTNPQELERSVTSSLESTETPRLEHTKYDFWTTEKSLYLSSVKME